MLNVAFCLLLCPELLPAPKKWKQHTKMVKINVQLNISINFGAIKDCRLKRGMVDQLEVESIVLFT